MSKATHIHPSALAEVREARLAAQVATQHVQIVCLRIAVRYGLPPGATWDQQGKIILPPVVPVRGEPVIVIKPESADVKADAPEVKADAPAAEVAPPGERA